MVKKVVAYIKRTGKNSQLSLGFELELEVETRFETVCEKKERFIKSAEKVAARLDEGTTKNATYCPQLCRMMERSFSHTYLQSFNISLLFNMSKPLRKHHITRRYIWLIPYWKS